jgi:hypothetical protein
MGTFDVILGSSTPSYATPDHATETKAPPASQQSVGAAPFLQNEPDDSFQSGTFGFKNFNVATA